MLIRPTEEELLDFGEPDFIIYNAGQFPANRFTKGMSSTTSVEINFKRMEMVILGTEYAGEMKKGVFSVMVRSFFLNKILSVRLYANFFFGLASITSNPSNSANSPSTPPQT
jgi:ATP-dependent phosphoenolpyruvate carboxykinase